MNASHRLLPALTAAAGLALASASALAEDNRYIIQFAPGAAGQGKAAIQALGGDIKVDLTDRAANFIAVELPAQAIKGLARNPNVLSIEPDSRVYPMADRIPYGIPMVQADLVSDADAANQKVCIIDSGYHIGHSDLQDLNVTATNDSRSGDPFIDSCGHGTHVAGTIVALANGDGVVGVLPSGQVGLHIVKTFGDDNWTGGSCSYSYSSDIVDAGYKCADAGASVINMSLGGGAFSSAAADAWNDILVNRNVLPVAAAGNDGTTNLSYPASYDAVVSVAAIDSNKNLASFSQRNSQVELAAPGVGVESTVPYGAGGVTVSGQNYAASPMERSAATTASGALVDGGLCDSVGGWSGRVVLCERGGISFSDKVANAEAGGAVATIIYNNEPGGFLGSLSCSGPSWRACTSGPAVSMSQEDGQTLVNFELGNSASVSSVTEAPASGYDTYNGTSMATPHVAGVAALVWSQFPTLTAVELRDVLAATAEDLGTSGRDNSFGWGLVQARAAVDFLGGSEPPPAENVAPTASFSASCTDLGCTFTDTSSDSDGTVAGWSWDFGDGTSSTAQSPSHSYAAEGTYTVRLTVTDNEGATDSASQPVTVTAPVSEPENTPPTASFTFSCDDLGCSFDGSGSDDTDGSIAGYAWDFGDGNSGSGQTASHTYGAAGTYTVTLTVTDDDGATNSSSESVTVEAPPVEEPGGITLSASGYKVKGRHRADLTWDGATSSNVDIKLGGTTIATTANDGAYTWTSNNRGGGSYTFQVCEAGTSTCSDSVTVVF